MDTDAAQLVKDSTGKSSASSVTPSLVRNTINNPMNPTKGSKQVLQTELAGLGGDQDFYLVEFRNSWYLPLAEGSWGELVLADRTNFGYGESFNDNPFPLYRRFFPGGINSVRGYRNRTLGPTDINGQEYGENCIEAAAVKACGARLHLVQRIPSLATSAVIEKIKQCG